MCIYIYIYTYMRGGLYCVCDHGKHRSVKGYNVGCNCVFVPPLPVPKVTPKIIMFSKLNLDMKCHYMNKVETPVWFVQVWHLYMFWV